MPIHRELIYINEKDVTESVEKYTFKKGRCAVVFKNSEKEFHYHLDKVRIEKTAVSGDDTFNVFKYLREIADTVGLKTEEGDNILSRSFNGISKVPEDCVLSSLLSGFVKEGNTQLPNLDFFPFGFNLSQRNAVNAAFMNQLSVIEGPPGTGKTQTILNIIANAVLRGQTVAVVSSNNSATKNVYEKLEKNGIEFIAALLGNSQNRAEFVASQKPVPDLGMHALSQAMEAELKLKAKSMVAKLSNNLEKKNELAMLRLQLDNVTTEFNHFNETFKNVAYTSLRLKMQTKSEDLLALWLSIENSFRSGNKIGFLTKLIYRWKYGIKDKQFYMQPFESMIYSCQAWYYQLKIKEITERIEFCEQVLAEFAFEATMEEYTDAAMQLLKNELSKRYSKKEREPYSVAELKYKSDEFIKEYPVIMSTTYSLRQSLSDKLFYDFVIIDESSQVDLATGALALSCAKRAVIVGDTKQLPNVVDSDMQVKTDLVFKSYQLKEPYRYATNSLLSSVLALLPQVPKTLLREHYRCHPKIIEFCNKKFYNDQLIIHSTYAQHRAPLIVYKTAQGNHARQRSNQRQVDIIQQEIIPNENLQDVDLGIVTPYRNQTNLLQQTFEGTGIKADTVDKFQGRENTVIIISTVDNEVSEFTDNPNRLNVAVSRAVEQLIVVVNGNVSEKDSNIADLIKYIEYNNFSIVQSELNSIFDLLYKGYEEERAKILGRVGKVSAFDSETLMYDLINQVLAEDQFSKYDVLLHFPLNRLIKDFSKLDTQEASYASHPFTHLDFIIYNKLGKVPVLGIEVDGHEYHKEGSVQAGRDRLKDSILEKYNFPLLRFRTTDSNEKQRLEAALSSI
jgi:KaiC/GvpD/RAD55 family RecA-like ATPase